MAEVINFPDINTKLTSGFWNTMKYIFGSRDQKVRRHGRQAELRVCSILEKNLPDTFLVVNNYRIDTSAGEKDIDHLVAGPTGLFCIDTKGVTGFITVNEDGCFDRKKNGYARDSKKHHKQVKGNVESLRRIFNRANLKGYIHPMLCFTFANVDLDEVGGVKIVYPGTLIESIMKPRSNSRAVDVKSFKIFFEAELARLKKRPR